MNITIPPSIEYKGDGTTKRFAFPFDYLRKAFIKVQLDDTEDFKDFEVDGKVVTFLEAPGVDAYIKIYRDTSTNRLVSWADASVLRAKDMTIQQIQELHILEEEDFRFQGIEEKVDNAVDDVTALVTTAENFAIEAGQKATDAQNAANQAVTQVDRIIEEGYNVSFANIEDMKNATLLQGMVVRTAGYYSANDGGDALYFVRQKKTNEKANKISTIELNNNLMAEIVYSKPFVKMLNSHSDLEWLADIEGTNVPNGWSTQGICYNYKTNKIILGIKTSDDTAQRLLIMNPENYSIENIVSFTTLGHINTLAYNADDDLIYVCTGNDGWKGYTVLNANTYTEVSRGVLNEQTVGIAYDNFYKILVSLRHNSKDVYYDIYDKQFNKLDVVQATIPIDSGHISNGFSVYKGKILTFFFQAILETDLHNKETKFEMHKSPYEYEDIAFTENGDAYVSCNIYGRIELYRLCSTYNSVNSNPQLVILNRDLNRFFNQGVYAVAHNDSGTYNFPATTVNGHLIVYSGCYEPLLEPSFIRQIFYRIGTNDSNSWQIFSRVYSYAAKAWSAWYMYGVKNKLSTPSKQKITITKPTVVTNDSAWNTINNIYTAPTDGTLYVGAVAGNTSGRSIVWLYDNSWITFARNITTNGYGAYGALAHVSKGTKINMQYVNINGIDAFEFFPDESEV